jgi:hypothetical protein
MLEYLSGKASARKLRLFSCACCRRIAFLMRPQGYLAYVEETEFMADAEGDAVRVAAPRITLERTRCLGGHRHLAALACRALLGTDPLAAAGEVSGRVIAAQVAFAQRHREDQRTALEREQMAHAGLLRCIFDNPFRPVAPILAWRTADAIALAKAAYTERSMPRGEMDQARLGVLADALEDAGASDELPAHLRGPGLHVRGCWVVDALTGRS